MKYNSEEIGNRIKNEREKRGWSQDKLGKKLFISGKQISIYESGSLPPLNNLLSLCEIFECELGFLLGEDGYAKGTQLKSQIYSLTGLTNQSIEVLGYITSPNSRFYFGDESETYREILNAFICSKGFVALMEALHLLDDCRRSIQNLENQLASSFDETTIKEALLIESGTRDYEHDESLPALPLAVCNARKMINEIIEEKDKISYSSKVARYEVNEAFISLINEISNKESGVTIK